MTVVKNDAPAQRFALLRKFIPRFLQPTLRGLKKRLVRPANLPEPYRSVFPYTQVHKTRQRNLVELAETIDRERISGSIVECGVLDGGTAALMAFATNSSNRDIHLFDSWEGLPHATTEDGRASMWVGEDVGSPRRVISVMKKLGINLSRLHFHRGWFHDTFPRTDIDNIALLHADGDFYESVRLTLETWLPKMTPGGFIQIDDYSAFVGCRRAVDELLAKNPDLRLECKSEDYAEVYFIRIPRYDEIAL